MAFRIAQKQQIKKIQTSITATIYYWRVYESIINERLGSQQPWSDFSCGSQYK